MRLFSIGALMLLSAALLAAQEHISGVERNALISIFRATHGERWKDTTGWLSPENGRQGDPGTECDWEGVACDPEKRHVTGLSLKDSGLAGVLPPSIGNLRQLETLDLSFNRLQGQLPKQMLRLKHLTRASLANNQLQGMLPSPLSSLAKIRSLDLSRNYFSGTIPELGGLRDIVSLDLSDNHLGGHLPSSLGELRTLQRLNLAGNYLTGVVPPQIGKMVSAVEISLAHNGLTGTLPREFGKLTKLQVLDLSYNSFNGPLPASLGMLQDLRAIVAGHNAFAGIFPAEVCQSSLFALDLSWNHLRGELPPDISKCSALAFLLLSHNALRGSLPSRALVSMDSLETLDLSDNAFSGDLAELPGPHFRALHMDRNQLGGPIPSQLLTDSLRELTLSGNRLTGGLPDKLCTLTSLRIVDLSHNGLSGPLCDGSGTPDALEDLEVLNLSNNQLEGPLPPSLFGLKRLASLYLSHNRLSGSLPEIGDLPRLQMLDLSYNRLSDVVPARLSKLPVLMSVNLGNNGFTSGLEDLAGARTLRQVGLRNNPWAEPVPLKLLQMETTEAAAGARAAMDIRFDETAERHPPKRKTPPAPPPDQSIVVTGPPTPAPSPFQSSITGSVADVTGALLPGARITAESPVANKTTTTDSQGRFQLTLPASDYRLTITSPGFQPLQRQVSIQPGSLQTIDVKLAVSAITEAVTVSDERPKTYGPWWNTWITKQGALETGREAFLISGRPYTFYLELSAIQSRDAARGETFKELSADLRQKLLQLVRDGTPLTSFFVRISIIGRAVELSRGVNSVQAWLPSNQWAPRGESASSGAFQADLSRLFPDIDSAAPADSDKLSAISAARAGAIQFGINAGKKPGCAAIAISIWDETRMVPLDQLVRMISVGQKTNCAGQVIENPTAPALYSDTARGVRPDVSLHVFELKLQGKPHSASFLVLRNPTTDCKSYQWDSDATLGMQVLSGDEFTQDLMQARNAGGSYAPVAKVLTNTVFAEADRTNTCGAVAALAALKQLAQKSDVQMFARVSDDQGTLNVVPLGLMAMHQEAGQNVFAHDIRLTQPVAQEALEDTGCVSDWTFLLPSDLDGFTPEQLELPPSLADARVYRNLDDFLKGFVKAPEDDGPSGLLLLVHHLSGTLTTSGNDKLSFGQINRYLGHGSIAILSACKTGNLSDDTGMVRSLNEHGVDAVVATAFELDEKFGKVFAFNFAELVHGNVEPVTVGLAFNAALSRTAGGLTGIGYTPEQARGMSLELVLAGNPNLKICRAKAVPTRY